MAKEIDLSLKNRFILMTLLPTEGGLIEMIIVNSINKMLSLSVEEIEEFEVRDIPNSGVAFNPLKSRNVVFQISDEQVKTLKSIPEKIDKEKRVTLEMLPLFDLISDL